MWNIILLVLWQWEVKREEVEPNGKRLPPGEHGSLVASLCWTSPGLTDVTTQQGKPSGITAEFGAMVTGTAERALAADLAMFQPRSSVLCSQATHRLAGREGRSAGFVS